MSKIILITGGTGTLGQALSRQLVVGGYQVRHLSRSGGNATPYPAFHWDVDKRLIDAHAFDGISSIIHLAGAGVADERWTTLRKAELLHSRVDSSKLLYDYVEKLGLKLDAFISASAIGYYGDAGKEKVSEESTAGHDFLAHVVQEWEESVAPFASLTRLVKIRIGIVLSGKGGALAKMAQPVRLGVGAPLGSGDQYMSWIHEEDVASVFQFALEQKIDGAYNAVAPHPVTNLELTRELARVLKRPLLVPAVPAWVLKIVLGEMAGMVLGGSKVSCEKLQKAGYSFKFIALKESLQDLLR